MDNVETGTARELDLQVGDVVEIDEVARDGKWHIKSVELLGLDAVFSGQCRINFQEGRPGIFNNEIFTVISRASTPETGTLAELGVKPGDVVEFVEGAREHGSGLCFESYKSKYGGYQYVIGDNGDADSDEDGSGGGWVSTCSHIFRIISRASGTPAQRYVVLTDDDTIICTRSEAEDLAAGGVDAVYKLGDKVAVTVKVELNDEV